MRIRCVVAGACVLAGVLSFAGGAQALTMKECSAKYKAAEPPARSRARSGMISARPSAAPTRPRSACRGPAATPLPPQTARPKSSGRQPRRQPPPTPIFPTAVSPKYSKESAGKARMHTCLDQYNANKASNGNGGLTWIMKGGGYYSQCNKRLKG